MRSPSSGDMFLELGFLRRFQANVSIARFLYIFLNSRDNWTHLDDVMSKGRVEPGWFGPSRRAWSPRVRAVNFPRPVPSLFPNISMTNSMKPEELSSSKMPLIIRFKQTYLFVFALFSWVTRLAVVGGEVKQNSAEFVWINGDSPMRSVASHGVVNRKGKAVESRFSLHKRMRLEEFSSSNRGADLLMIHGDRLW